MKIIQVLFLFFLIIPFIEIYLLLKIGGIIGVMPTIFMVVLTAVIGAWMLRQQGFATWQRFQEHLNRGEIPAYEIIEGPILLVGGALLLTPGFFTDALGFACLVPQLRRQFAQYIIESRLVSAELRAAHRKASSEPGQVIEGEYRKEE